MTLWKPVLTDGQSTSSYLCLFGWNSNDYSPVSSIQRDLRSNPYTLHFGYNIRCTSHLLSLVHVRSKRCSRDRCLYSRSSIWTLRQETVKQGWWPFVVYSGAYSLHCLIRRLVVRPPDVATVKVADCSHDRGVGVAWQSKSSTTHAQTCVTPLFAVFLPLARYT